MDTWFLLNYIYHHHQIINAIDIRWHYITLAKSVKWIRRIPYQRVASKCFWNCTGESLIWHKSIILLFHCRNPCRKSPNCMQVQVHAQIEMHMFGHVRHRTLCRSESVMFISVYMLEQFCFLARNYTLSLLKPYHHSGHQIEFVALSNRYLFTL